MSSKVSSTKGVVVGPASSKRLAKVNKKQHPAPVMSSKGSSSSGGRVNHPHLETDDGSVNRGYTPVQARVGGGPFEENQEPHDGVIVHVVPPSSPVPNGSGSDPDDDEIDYQGDPPDENCPGDPMSTSTSTPGGTVIPHESSSPSSRDIIVQSNQESDQFLDDEDDIDCSDDCEEDDDDEEDVSSDCLGEEEEDDEDVDEEEDEDDDECVPTTDEMSDEDDDDEDEQDQQPTNSRNKPLPQHRPQLPIIERTCNNKRRGRTPGGPGHNIGNAASAIKRVRGISGIRTTKCTPIGTSTILMGKSKSIVNNLRKNRRSFTSSANPIFLHNTSSDDPDEEPYAGEYVERVEGTEDEDEDDGVDVEPSGFLLGDADSTSLQNIPPDATARLEAFFEAAGFTDGKLMSDPDSLRKLTLTVSSALGEASAAINRMRDSQRKSIEEGRSDSLEEGDSLLALACSSGYFELARVLLAMGANVDDRGSKGDLTPLMDAASQGHLEIVRLLLSHGADVNAQSACGNSALMYACASGHVTVVEELLKHGAHVEDNNENGHTPLMEAASAGHVPVAKLLLKHGAGINTHSNEFKESALTVACYKGHLDMVKFLLEAGADQQHKTDEMHTALMEASMDGHVEVARLLLDSGAQVNMPADSFESPLTLAACGGHVELAELLLERGANIEEVNDEGYTPLMEAAREGHLCVVKTLLKHHAKVNAKTEDTQETALTLAACGGFLDVVDLLTKAGADVELGASTPLMEAAQEGHIVVVRFLVERGANVLRENASKDIALSFAAENGHLEVVDALVELGSNPEHVSEGGRSPLMKAARGGHVGVIKFLLSLKADVNRQTESNDHTALSLACAGGHLAAVEILLAAGANPYHKLKDNSTMIIEAARGGHTAVIRSLLDYLPPNAKAAAAKAQAQAKQGQISTKGAGTGLQQKQVVDQKNAAQGKPSTSVLRKCRSTSTLDSAPPQGAVPAKDSGEGKTKVKLEQVTPVDASSKDIPTRTGEIHLDSKSLPTQSLPSSGKSLTVTDGAKVSNLPTGGKGNESSHVVKPTIPGFCPDCCKSSNVSTEPPQALQPTGHVHVKRPAATDAPVPMNLQHVSPSSSITAGIVTPTFGPIPSTGPPLVASQVTAATAISERPKLKSKPRKTSQLQNQTQPATVLSNQGSNGTSPGSSGEKSQPTTAPNSPTSPPNVGNAGQAVPVTPTGIAKGSALSQGTFVPAGMVQQVLTNSGPSIDLKDFKDIKLDAKQLTQIFAQHRAAALLQGQGNLEQNLTSNSPGTTTTSTTVVVTHGNGETETIFDGDNLPPGANEVIMNAAAAAFPLDCFPLPAIQVGQGGEVHVQSYQVGGSGDGSTTTMQTTTIINAAASLNSFQQQIILPPHHPPPLPAAFAAAAAAAGLVPPTGAPPPGAVAGLKSGTKRETPPSKPQPPSATTPIPTPKISGTSAPPGQPPIPVNQVPPVSSLAAPVGQKKQLAKRTRPIAQSGSCSRQSNQHTQTHGLAHGHSHGKQNQSVASTQTTITGQQVNGNYFDVNNATESSGETSLSIAAAAGHYEVVDFLLSRKANIEHRDKKGCTPLILAADGGFDKVVELLLSRGADIEAQSDRTKDTALSLACTKGRFEVVDLLLKKGANKEHRNVSDYTPLSLAASGGYVNIIKLLLQNGAEINSRTGSKLGISPLMLAAMNGNSGAVKLLLDMGSDINAQIETNKNTALTLACFQGRHEVVSLLLDRKANLEHRAKTGLTPLMEAANGGYSEVGRILLEKGADVNASPVPATKDTALSIAADKGHCRFVELLLARGSAVEVRNKKGCTPVWLACNGGHLDVAQILAKHRADLDVQDNRKVSCLMAAFRKGHVKVIRWIVKNVQQFPSDCEMLRYFTSIQGEPELLKKCQQCGEYIKNAKDKQALEANKNASILLEELDMERSREESKRQAAARRREKKKKKKLEKRLGPSGEHEGDEDEDGEDDDEDSLNIADFGIDANSLGSNSSTNGKSNKENLSTTKSEKEDDSHEPKPSAKSRKRRNKKERERQSQLVNSTPQAALTSLIEERKLPPPTSVNSTGVTTKDVLREKDNKMTSEPPVDNKSHYQQPTPKGKDKRTRPELVVIDKKEDLNLTPPPKSHHSAASGFVKKEIRGAAQDSYKDGQFSEGSRRNISMNFDDASSIFPGFGYTSQPFKSNTTSATASINMSSKGRKDDGWKEVTRSFPSSRSKKVIVPSSVISRVIGRGGCNINAIREATGAHIEVEKQQKGQIQPERTIQIKGTVESTKQAHTLITALMNEPDLDVKKLLPGSNPGSGVPKELSSFTTGIFSVPVAISTAWTSQRSTITNSTNNNSPPTIMDNIPFTTFSAAAINGGKMKSTSKSTVSPPVGGPKPTTPVNGSSTSAKGNLLPPTKKPTPLLAKVNSSTGPLLFSSNNSTSSSIVNSFVTKSVVQSTVTTTLSNYVHSGSQASSSQRSSTPSGQFSTPTSSPAPSSSPSLGSNNGDAKGIFTSVSGQIGNSTQVLTNSNLGSLTNPIPATQPHLLSKETLGKTHGSQNGKPVAPVHPQSQRSSSPIQIGRNMAPGTGVIGPPGAARVISSTDNPEQVPVSTSTQPSQTLEYSPFNYTAWFPAGDLAQASVSSTAIGVSNNFGSNQTVGSPLGHIGSVLAQTHLNSSAARAMNFASVAASGISSTSLSTSTAHMSHPGGLQNGGLGPSLTGTMSLGSGKVICEQLDSDLPKTTDVSKAPGYRGTTVGSPVLRMGPLQSAPVSQPNPSPICLENNPMASQFGGIQAPNMAGSGGMLNMTSVGGPGQGSMGFGNNGGRNTNTCAGGLHMNILGLSMTSQNFGTGMTGPEVNPGLISQSTTNSIMYGTNSGGILPPPTPPNVGIPSSSQSQPAPSIVSSATSTVVPTNVVLSSRLNPRAPSFTLSQHSKIGHPPQQQPIVPNFQQQLPPIHNQQPPPQQIHNAFKVGNNFGNRNANLMGARGQGGGGPGMSLGSSWNTYGNEMDLTNLAALASASMDPQILGYPGMDQMPHDNQSSMKEGRLPRPIGGERAWKNASVTAGAGNLNNMGPFSSLDCMDPTQVSQSIPVSNHQAMIGQNQGWMSPMYGPPQQYAQVTNQTGIPGAIPRSGNEPRNFLGRRFIDEDPTGRMVELQQMIDGQHRMMNGGIVPPMHMAGNLQQPPLMYSFGVGPPGDHLEHLGPKLDQHTNSWDNHIHTLEEKHMNWGSKWGN